MASATLDMVTFPAWALRWYQINTAWW